VVTMRVKKNQPAKNDGCARVKRFEDANAKGYNHRLALTIASNSPGDTPKIETQGNRIPLRSDKKMDLADNLAYLLEAGTGIKPETGRIRMKDSMFSPVHEVPRDKPIEIINNTPVPSTRKR
jgi:hypothetical protein